MNDKYGVETELFERWQAEFERNHPQVIYDGAIEPDEDWADYRGFSVKGVRLG